METSDLISMFTNNDNIMSEYSADDHMIPYQAVTYNASGEVNTTISVTTDDDLDYDPNEDMSTFYLEEVIPTVFIYSLTFFLGILGNSFIIFTIARHRRMRTVTNVFLASLASADLLLILICVPAKLAKLLSFSWGLGEFLCKFVHYMQTVSAICSVLTLTSMSIERYYAILHPMKAKYICTISQARKVIFAIWLLSFILGIPTIFVQVQIMVGERIIAYWCVLDWENPILWRTYAIYLLVLNLVLPACIMGYAYTNICCEVWQVMKLRATMTGGSDKMRNGADPPHEMHTLKVKGHRPRYTTQRLKRTGFAADEDSNTVKQVIKMLVAVVVLFIICWAPMLVTEVITSFGIISELNTGYLKPMRATFTAMAYFNSCINPIVYGFMSRNFRMSFYSALCLCRYGHPIRQMSFSTTRSTSVSLGRSMSVSTHTNAN